MDREAREGPMAGAPRRRSEALRPENGGEEIGGEDGRSGSAEDEVDHRRSSGAGRPAGVERHQRERPEAEKEEECVRHGSVSVRRNGDFDHGCRSGIDAEGGAGA
jgi:hypothetical protein